MEGPWECFKRSTKVEMLPPLICFVSLLKVALLSKEDDIEADFERQVCIFPLLSIFLSHLSTN